MLQYGRDLAMARINAPCVGEAGTSGRWDVEMQTMVVTARGANIESISSMWCPRGPCGRIVVHQCLST
jgi:hypothetical protein